MFDSTHVPNAPRSLRLAGALLASLALSAGAAAQTSGGVSRVVITPQPICQNVPNGSFHNGFTGWTLDPCTGGFGDWNAFAGATIDDLTSIGCDSDVACLNISTDATWTCEKPSGSASQAQVSISRKAVVRGRHLRFKAVGGFEFFLFDQAVAKYDAWVYVTDEEGDQVKCEILSYDFEVDYGCPAGIQALGAIPLDTICCNLAGSGIEIGETVTIQVVWSASVIACNDCDSGQFFGSLCVDEFEWCAACLTPVPLPLQPVLTTSAAVAGVPVQEVAWTDPVLAGEHAVLHRLNRAAAVLGIDLSAQPAKEDDER